MGFEARKGNFTVPNLISVVFLLFIFAVFFEPINFALSQMAGTGSNADILTQAVLYALPALMLLSIIAAPWILKEKKKIIRQQNGGQRK